MFYKTIYKKHLYTEFDLFLGRIFDIMEELRFKKQKFGRVSKKRDKGGLRYI